MSDGDSLTARVAALAAVVVFAVACNGETADDRADPSDAAASPDPTSDPAGSEEATSSAPTPTPTPTETPTGPDDEGWAEHLGLTEEELEERRASDDFLEFAEARRAREHPRFKNTHGNIGFEAVPSDGLGAEKGDWGRAINAQDVARAFLRLFRDTLLAENLNPAPGAEIPGVGGSYVFRIGRSDSGHRQLLMAVAFYENDRERYRARVGLAAADVNVLDSTRNHVELNVAQINPHVTDVPVGDSWDDTYEEKVYNPVGNWLEAHR